MTTLDCGQVHDGRAWSQTIGGGAFTLSRPEPEQIKFPRIAMVLGKLPRFGAQNESEHILSIAQHCDQGARAILRDTGRRDAAAAFLLHDAHEAFITDIPTPVLHALCEVADEEWHQLHHARPSETIKRAVKVLKKRIDAVLYPAAGLPWPLAPDVAAIVHEYDVRMCRTERDLFLAKPPQAWGDLYETAEPVAGVLAALQTPKQAARDWLLSFWTLTVNT